MEDKVTQESSFDFGAELTPLDTKLKGLRYGRVMVWGKCPKNEAVCYLGLLMSEFSCYY